ncbi:thiamine phosphate synthase [Candidatus Pelagibacter sp.]|nr:thiamine phosphate synthase [Candidatus Pelagibacter sp.]
MKPNKTNNNFVYLISPNSIENDNFYSELDQVLSSKKVSFFQLRLKKETYKNKIIIGKKIKKICKQYKVKFIINDDPMLTKKLNADGCHLGQKDMSFLKARKILKNKIIGVTCHNSINLAKKAIQCGANYLAFGAFYSSKTKKNKYKANIKILNLAKKITKIPIVAIGGIKLSNYKKLLLNKASFLAISGYIWNNKKYKPLEAIKKLK